MKHSLLSPSSLITSPYAAGEQALGRALPRAPDHIAVAHSTAPAPAQLPPHCRRPSPHCAPVRMRGRPNGALAAAARHGLSAQNSLSCEGAQTAPSRPPRATVLVRKIL